MRWSMLGVLAVASGCVKQAPAVQSPQPWTVAVVAVLEAAEEGTLAGAPDDLVDAMREQADARALNAVVVEPDTWLETFRAKRTTEQRVTAVSESARTDLLLLVETDARWYSQIAGRFRWTVDVDLSFGKADDVAGVSHQHFEVPVALLFDHQREDEAVAAAGPIIERRVGELMDTWLRAAE